MPVYKEYWGHKDKCFECERAYTAYLVKWWSCSDRNCSKDSVKIAICSECLVKRIENKTWPCHCCKKISAECGELSVEELNSKDSWLEYHKDSVKEEWNLKGEELLE